MALSKNEGRSIFAMGMLVTGAYFASYSCPDQTKIKQCPLSVVMISVALLFLFMTVFSLCLRMREQSTHTNFPYPKSNNRSQKIWGARNNNVQNLTTTINLQNKEYGTIPI